MTAAPTSRCSSSSSTPILANATIANATASFYSGPQYAPQMAIDGSLHTRWSSSRNNGSRGLNDWIAVELASLVRIHSCRIVWNEAWAWSFGIFVRSSSTDPYTFVSNHTFQNIQTVLVNRRIQTVLLNCTAVYGRFVKIVSYSERLSSTSIWEIDVVRDITVSEAPTSLAPTAQPTLTPTVSPTSVPTAALSPWRVPCYTRPWVSNRSASANFTSDGDDLSGVQRLEDEFENAIELTPSLTFLWSSNGTDIHMAVRCALTSCAGYIGIGFSNTGRMVGSHAIIGQCAVPMFGSPVGTVRNGPDDTLLANETAGIDPLAGIRAQTTAGLVQLSNYQVREYYLGGKSVSQVLALPNTSQSLYNTSCTVSSSDRIMRFSRRLITPTFSIDPIMGGSPRQRVIYAIGRYNELAFHASMGVRSWTGRSSAPSSPTNQTASPTLAGPPPTPAPIRSPTPADESTDLSDSTTGGGGSSSTVPLAAGVAVGAALIVAAVAATIYRRQTRSAKRVPTGQPRSSNPFSIPRGSITVKFNPAYYPSGVPTEGTATPKL